MVKKGKIALFFLIIALFASGIAYFAKPVVNDVSLGLDLQGGFEVLYEVEPMNEGDEINQDSLLATTTALNERVNTIGVSEPNIQIEGENRIRVQLAGVEDQETARDILATGAELTIRDVDDNVLLDGSDLTQNGASASVHPEKNQPIVTLTLNDADKFGEITREISERPLGENLLVIWLDFEEGDSFAEESKKQDPKYMSAASVNAPLHTRDVMIEGNFTTEETRFLAEILNAGALPVELNEIYSTSVGASLGEKAMNQTIFAGSLGVGLIFLYMVVYYRFPGIIAVITLSIYTFLVLVVFNAMNAVLTLPGIAALVLGVGMAVDANIITYERIKEEIKSGKSILSAFKVGSRRSFATIFDANITTLIAAGVMFYFGTSSVQGFAVMLIISILVSFLTAVYGSRVLLGLWVNSKFLNKRPGWFGVKRGEIDEL
ncbi:protein translocase subunit SecD [Shouchella clausii]|uniref:Protein translocase subunit SecD n=1 Tax=Shouchella clausii TaxID=79880 RepID=A0A268S4V0_SHOCL|nr:protein translocase subunit SecD [Shouchella clausii]PAD43714.1 protein translocase subunit SecD [Bacillus sp. 7520-S]MBU8595242.1 protein translocase subunit SecD [Shouchella clausii]MCY1103300.1 protein translocase subunit SecD [Shouchella clausii]MEB5479129.1 protein translocase subunit SecD [Shouchella clausii]MED4157063.1 protein translocase subunit SecD [Shouchella clausii]